MSSIDRRPAGASGMLSGIAAIARRPAGASGITTTWGNSESGGRGILVQTVVLPNLNLEKDITAGGNSSIIIRDEDELGPTSDIDSPIEANSIEPNVGAIDTIKWALRDDEGSATWDGAVNADSSTWQYTS